MVPRLVDRVSGVASLHVIIVAVSVQQSWPHLTLQHLGSMSWMCHILIWHCIKTNSNKYRDIITKIKLSFDVGVTWTFTLDNFNIILMQLHILFSFLPCIFFPCHLLFILYLFILFPPFHPWKTLSAFTSKTVILSYFKIAKNQDIQIINFIGSFLCHLLL